MESTEQLDDWLDDFIVRAMAEDVGDGDHTSQACIPEDAVSRAQLLVKDPGVIAGIEVARRVLLHADPNAKIDLFLSDGAAVNYGDIAFKVTANTRALLRAERLLLNTMQRMSGIATLANRYLFEVEDLPVKILDTRKTTPLLRPLEKWAVRLGGCHNYRDGLYDWIMIKDNHVEAAGGIRPAIERVHTYLKRTGRDLNITVEVRNLVEMTQALEAGGITRIMFDNFEVPLLREAVAHVNGRFQTEASGGINLHTIRKYAQTGVEYISVGALTHSAVALDLSLKIID